MEHNNPTLDLDVIKNADITLLDEHSWAILARGEQNLIEDFPNIDGYFAREALDEAGLPFDSVILVSNSENGIIVVSRKRLEKAVKDIITLYHDKLVEKDAVFQFGRGIEKNDDWRSKDYGLKEAITPFHSISSSGLKEHPVGLPSDAVHWGYDYATAVMDNLGVEIQANEVPYFVEFFDEVSDILYRELSGDIKTMLESGIIDYNNIAQKVADNFDAIPSTGNKYNPPIESFDIFKGLSIENRERLMFLLETEYGIVENFTDSFHSIISHINNSLHLPVIYIPELLSTVRSIKNKEEGDIEDVIVADMSTDGYCAYENFRVAEKVEDGCLYAIAELNRGTVGLLMKWLA